MAAAGVENFLGAAGFARAPWLVIAFAAGIGLWFQLPGPGQWLALISSCLLAAAAAFLLLRVEGAWPYLRQALGLVALSLAAGCLVVWGKSALVGAPAISMPYAGTVTGTVLARQEQPADARVRLMLAIREPGPETQTARAIRVRLNVPLEHDRPGQPKARWCGSGRG